MATPQIPKHCGHSNLRICTPFNCYFTKQHIPTIVGVNPKKRKADVNHLLHPASRPIPNVNYFDYVPGDILGHIISLVEIKTIEDIRGALTVNKRFYNAVKKHANVSLCLEQIFPRCNDIDFLKKACNDLSQSLLKQNLDYIFANYIKSKTPINEVLFKFILDTVGKLQPEFPIVFTDGFDYIGGRYRCRDLNIARVMMIFNAPNAVDLIMGSDLLKHVFTNLDYFRSEDVLKIADVVTPIVSPLRFGFSNLLHQLINNNDFERFCNVTRNTLDKIRDILTTEHECMFDGVWRETLKELQECAANAVEKRYIEFVLERVPYEIINIRNVALLCLENRSIEMIRFVMDRHEMNEQMFFKTFRAFLIRVSNDDDELIELFTEHWFFKDCEDVVQLLRTILKAICNNVDVVITAIAKHKHIDLKKYAVPLNAYSKASNSKCECISQLFGIDDQVLVSDRFGALCEILARQSATKTVLFACLSIDIGTPQF